MEGLKKLRTLKSVPLSLTPILTWDMPAELNFSDIHKIDGFKDKL